jgi:hypothetical protein
MKSRLAWTPEGLYDGSENARQLVRFCLNGSPDPELASNASRQQAVLKQRSDIRSRNYFPGLVQAIFNGERPTPKPVD